MSILLEALRKSERNQQSREVPTIHTGDQSGPVAESLKTGPFVLIIAAVLLLSGWSTWRQYRAPDNGSQPPVTLAQDKTPAASGQLASSPPGAGEGPQSRVSPAANDNTRPQQRTPVESYKGPAPDTSPPASGNTEAPPGGGTANRAAGGSTSRPAKSATASSAPVTVNPAKSVPYEPAPISYWELPDAIRADITEIKFSVLVFANNPADRFVLVNGQRFGEGDSFQPGLVVKEIRRDGIVFKYRIYEFLVER